MKYFYALLYAVALTAVLPASSATHTDSPLTEPAASAVAAGADLKVTGLHDFDFEIGEWRVHHRARRAGVAEQWEEFDGTCVTRHLMDGHANVEDHVFNKPSGITRGVGLRAYDAKTGQWAIWWIDSRDPHGALDPPVIGSFENGVGTFYSVSTIDGKSIRTRYLWTHITQTSARWEQALSPDSGKTWETNWIMEFRRR